MIVHTKGTRKKFQVKIRILTKIFCVCLLGVHTFFYAFNFFLSIATYYICFLPKGFIDNVLSRENKLPLAIWFFFMPTKSDRTVDIAFETGFFFVLRTPGRKVGEGGFQEYGE